MTGKLKIGALISGGGTNLQAIIQRCQDGALDAELVFVGSDNPAAGGLERARPCGIETFVVDYPALIGAYRQNPEHCVLPDDFDIKAVAARQTLMDRRSEPKRLRLFLETRAIAEAGLLKKMAAYPFDLLVLAGFMRTLTPYFIDRVNTTSHMPRIMNIHPALLPAFPGVDGYGDTFRYGCKVAGCTVHFVDYGEDTGPIIGQKAFAIESDDTLETVRQKGLALEWQLYPECIQLYAEGRLKLEQKQYTLKNGKQVQRRIVKVLPVES